MYSLGINLSHDRSACLIGPEGQLVAIAEERLDRSKNSCFPDIYGRWFTLLPIRSIRYCLEAFGIGLDDLNVVVFCNAVVIEGNSIRNLTVSDCVWQLPWSMHTKLYTLNHHLAHAYSAFYPSSFDEAAILVIDKGGSIVEWHNADGIGNFPLLERTSIYHGTAEGIKNLIKIADRQTVPYLNSNSLGAIYEQATTFIGYTAFDSGKTMGLAPYGSRAYVDRMRQYVKLVSDGYDASSLIQTVGYKLFPHVYESTFGAPGNSPKQPSENDKAVARAAQELIEESVCHLATLALKKSGSNNLCIVGGIALNSVANMRIKRELALENLFIQPASADDGTALGAAIFGWRNLLEQSFPQKKWHTFLGRVYTSDEIVNAIFQHPKYNLAFNVKPVQDLHIVAELIARGDIVAWFSGSSEFGPRALGHRSILADPRRHDMKDILNARVKHRESFRPFATSVLLDMCLDYFDISSESPYMLLVANVLPHQRSRFPAITHVDGTCRIQTVTQNDNEEFYNLIKAYYNITGVPLILNTSFNVAKQPIIETPTEAIECFLGTEIDCLYIQGFLLTKNGKH